MGRRITTFIALSIGLAACGSGANPGGSAPPSGPAAPSATGSLPGATAPTATPPSAPLAPDFELATFDGGTFRLSDFRGKMPVLLNFWAPW